MINSPLISVIIPTHLRPLLLKRALESINTQYLRSQIEIIVVSDAIDGATDEACHSLLGINDIYVRRNGEPGPSASRNMALELARGKYVMFLDDDDSWHPEFTVSLHEFLPKFNAHLAYMNCMVVKESRSVSGPIKLQENFLDLAGMLTNRVFVKNQVHMSCYLFPRNLITGMQFDSNMRAYEDWDFQLSAIEKEFPIHIPILSSCIYEVDDETSDRRGASDNAKNFNAVIDYLYVYRRHTAPTEEIQIERQNLLNSAGLNLLPSLL